MKHTLLIFTPLVLLILGCTPTGYNTKMSPRDIYFLDLKKSNNNHTDMLTDTKSKVEKKTEKKKSIEDMTYRDSSLSSSQYQSSNKKGKIKQYKIVAEDMKVDKFLYYIFQESLKTDFFIDPKIKDIKKTITIKLDKKMTELEFIELLKELLKPYKVRLVAKDDIYRATFTSDFPREAVGGSVLTSLDIRQDISNDTIVTQYIECDYIDPNDMMLLASGIYYRDVTTKPVKGQNGFLIHGTYEQIKKILGFKKVVDRPFMKDKQTSLVYFDYITPSEFKTQFSQIVSYQKLEGQKDSKFKLLAFDNISALMVITSNRKNLKFLLRWKNKLDSYIKNSETKETYFYRSKYRSVEEIYDLISQFDTNNLGSKSKEGKQAVKSTKKDFVKTKATDKQQITNTTATQLDNGIKIIPDPERNLLIIRATPVEYKKILTILKKIDTQPLQILVEANIIEVTLVDDLQYGMEWFLRNSSAANPKTGSSVNISGKTQVGIGGGGFFGLIGSDYFNTVLNLFAKKQLINVLSHPKVMVLNGESASIQVGENIPVLSSTMSNITNPENAISTVTYSSTGISLNVTPSVTSSGTVTLEVSQQISKGQKNGLSSISSPIILNRSVSTKIVLKDNQSVIMGGLIQQDVSDTNTKVPLFGDLPLVGQLFRSTSKNLTKTELILVLKVHIIDNFDVIDDIKTQFSQLLTTTLDEYDSSNIDRSYKEPDILITPDNLDKYYNGEMDKYCNTEETIETIEEVKVVKVVKEQIKNIPQPIVKTSTDESGWVFVGEDLGTAPNIAQAVEEQTEVYDGKKYKRDSDGDLILVD